MDNSNKDKDIKLLQLQLNTFKSKSKRLEQELNYIKSHYYLVNNDYNIYDKLSDCNYVCFNCEIVEDDESVNICDYCYNYYCYNCFHKDLNFPNLFTIYIDKSICFECINEKRKDNNKEYEKYIKYDYEYIKEYNSKINNEIKCLPGIGILYKEAFAEFEKNKI